MKDSGDVDVDVSGERRKIAVITGGNGYILEYIYSTDKSEY
jgi:hypothetical protein